MIAAQVVDEIRRLLAEGHYSQRQIARLMNVNRGTVGAIAAGRRPDYQSLRQNRREEPPQPVGPPQRCPGCGGMVYLPCRLCRARAAKDAAPRRHALRPPLRADEPLQLNLKEEHRLRYQQVRARRISTSQGNVTV